MTAARILSRHDFEDGRCIEQLESHRGEIFYRVCTADRETCRFCEDLWMAHLYAERLCSARDASG
jgi:hypothetical protein